MTEVFQKVVELPETIRRVLQSVGYRRDDIGLNSSETYCPRQAGGQGRRAFVIVVNIATGERQDHVGSWGGENMFTRNRVDSDGDSYPIPPGVAIIKGSQGDKVFASLILRPENIVSLLPPKAELTERQSFILRCYRSLTSTGRKNKWERTRSAPTQAELNELVVRGYLAKAGSGLKITTEGKNAIMGHLRAP